jgi:chromosome segregation ATPase
VCADFHNHEEELKNALAASRSKIHGLKGKVREIEAGDLELKQAMKEATESEYAVSQKLAYETATRRGLEVEFEVVLKSLQSDQITIARYEVELNDLKGAANYAMSFIPVLEEGDQQQSIIDRLVDTPKRLLLLLRATGLAAATDALVRVKSHYPEVNMTKIRAMLTPQRTSTPWSSKLMKPAPRWQGASNLKEMAELVVKVATATTSSG